MEQLLTLKEMEIERLSKIKTTLKEQLIKIKKENSKFKEEITDLKEMIQVSEDTSYPELEEKIKTQERDLRQLKKDLRREKLKNAKIGIKAGDSDENPSDEEFEEEKEGVIGEIEEEVKITVVMTQLKNGMFKLGQQNFNLENKLDFIIETLQSGRIISASETSDEYAESTVASEMEQESKISSSPQATGRRPSDILKARQEENEPDEEEYVSPGLQASNAGETDSKPKKMIDPIVRSGKEDTGAEAPLPDSETEKPIKPKGALPTREIKSMKYPKDGVLKCPHCKAQNYQEMVNKAKVISFTPVKKYGKKYYCKKCRGEWDYK